jgi:hypothetical protein
MTFVGEHRRASVRDLTRPVGCHGGFFFFAFGWRGSLFLTFKPLLLRRRRWIRPRKSGGPPLFELSLKVQRDVAHYPPPGSRSCPGTTASTRSALKRSQMVPRGDYRRTHMRWEWSARTPRTPRTEPSPAAFPESAGALSRRPLERREISVDCMSYKDGDAKHT